MQTNPVDTRYFVGLPAPAAACALGSILFFAPTGPYWRWGAIVLILSLLFLGGLMLSTFRYWSAKRIDLRQRWSYRMIFPVAAVLLVVAYHPPAFFRYVLLGENALSVHQSVNDVDVLAGGCTSVQIDGGTSDAQLVVGRDCTSGIADIAGVRVTVEV